MVVSIRIVAHTIPGTSVQEVSTQDPRTALHGQKSLLATKDMLQGTDLGCYGGTLLDEADLLAMYDAMPLQQCYQLDDYAFGLSVAWDGAGWTTTPSQQSKSVIHDARYSPFVTDLIYMNDGLADPLQTGRFSELKDIPPSVGFAEALVDNWPTVFVIALTHIHAGQELLVSYGPSYWGAVQGREHTINKLARIAALIKNVQHRVMTRGLSKEDALMIE